MARTESPKLKFKERIVLELNQIEDLILRLENRPATQMAVYLALYTGMRRGEICGLQWRNVDWSRQTIYIAQQRLRIKKEDHLTQTKTAGSMRPVPVSFDVINKLAEWRRQQVSSNPDDLVIRHPNGGIPDPHTITSEFRKLVNQLGYIGYTFHDLRHAHATLLLKGKVPMKVVSERLGHSSTIVTANVYSHVTETMQQEAVNVFDQVVAAERAKNKNETNNEFATNLQPDTTAPKK